MSKSTSELEAEIARLTAELRQAHEHQASVFASLKDEVARLTEELRREREKSAGLQRQIDARREQDVRMVAHRRIFHRP